MKRTPHYLAIALVATALCADRAMAASPVVRRPAESVASRIVAKLTVSLRRVAPSIRLGEFRQGAAASAVVVLIEPQSARLHGARLSPLLLHLPPPIV
jgi:hypothetical protein